MGMQMLVFGRFGTLSRADLEIGKVANHTHEPRHIAHSAITRGLAGQQIDRLENGPHTVDVDNAEACQFRRFPQRRRFLAKFGS
jgi:hypothetical protein